VGSERGFCFDPILSIRQEVRELQRISQYFNKGVWRVWLTL
jgi:hypothetical protein